ncbi:hypothetical protein LOAG_18488, partial [Loa loa]
IFIFVIKNVIGRILLEGRTPPVDVINLLSRNTIKVDYEEAFQYACTDLSRFTAQLWHECGIHIYDENYHIGQRSFSNLYRHLTGESKLSISFVPKLRIEKFTEEVMQLINVESFRERLCMEPLKWYRFTLLKPSKNYCEIFLRSCFRQCRRCQKKSTHQYLCLLCGRLFNFDQTCYDIPGCLIFHAKECGNSAICFLSIANKVVIIILGQLGAIWGHLYFDIHGNANYHDPTHIVPLFLSQQHFHKLIEDWTWQSFTFMFKNLTDLIGSRMVRSNHLQ